MQNKNLHNNELQNLGLCRKAGFLITGFDAVKQSAAKPYPKGAAGILTASDISEKTRKEMNFFAGKYGKTIVELCVTMAEIESIFGKRAGVFAVTDDSFFKIFNKVIHGGN